MPRTNSDTPLSRRDFVGAAATIAAAAAIPGQRASAARPPLPRATQSPPIEERSIGDLSAAMRDGQLTARAITQQYLDRIASLDHQGPSLHYIIETNPDALAIADTLDAERTAGPWLRLLR